MARAADSIEPSLKDIIESKAPIFLPWSKANIYLGNGFDSRRALENKVPWTGRTPFKDLHLATFQADIHSGHASFKESTSTLTSADSRHLSASLGVTAGCDFASVNVTGSYDETTSNQKGDTRASRHATHVAGELSFEQTPALTTEAQQLLRSDPAAFQNTFGDYYVAALQLGASAGMSVTCQSDSHVHEESVKVSMTAHFLFWDATAEWSSDSRDATFNFLLAFCGYNTLEQTFDQRTCLAGQNAGEVLRPAGSYGSQIAHLQQTLEARLAERKLDKSSRVSWGDVHDFCVSGLVSHVILRPYDQLPGVAVWRSRKTFGASTIDVKVR